MFKVAAWSCTAGQTDCPAIYTGQRLGAKVFVSQGDDPYMQQTVSSMGGSRAPLTGTSSVADFVNSYSITYDGPAIGSLGSSSYDFYKMPDDHEWGGDNWDHTATQAESQTGISAGGVQATIDQHFTRGITAHQQVVSTYCDNPANTDADAIAEIPAISTLTASSYPVIYFRVGYDVNGNINNTTPHVEFFFIDCFSYRDPIAATDDGTVASPNKTMLGVNQRDWLKAHLLSSTATFKVIFSGKRTYRHTVGNADTWNQYTKERDNILQYIEDNSITGMLWVAGDQHFPHVIATEAGVGTPTEGGSFYDHVCMTACPVYSNTNSTDVGNGVIWAHDAYVMGIVEINQTYIEASIREVNRGGALWIGRVVAGDNALSYPPRTVSI